MNCSSVEMYKKVFQNCSGFEPVVKRSLNKPFILSLFKNSLNISKVIHIVT